METVTVKGDHITLDMLLWRRHGVRGRSLVEAALDLNPGIAGLGAVLPLGTIVTLPVLPAAAGPAPARIVSLFG